MDPIADASAMDEFAQTRGSDDLFDDEIIPVATEEQPQPEIQVHQEENITTLESEVQPVRIDTPPRSRGGERRGRGRGRGRGGRGSHPAQRRADGGGPTIKSNDNAVDNESGQVEKPNRDTLVEGTGPSTKDDDATSESKPTTEVNETEAQRVPAVRGDRSATGGIKKPKLTEEELSRRIAAAKENAAKVAAAHARAEADQASFLEREKVAEKKRHEERQNRRVMDSERERNRQRKLNALTAREWDAEKREEDYNPRGGKGQFRRGMHGGISGHVRRDFEDAPAPAGEETPNGHHQHRGRGRGGRGGRGRGGSRGHRADASAVNGASNAPATTKPLSAPVIDNEMEFPALPGDGKDEDKAADKEPAPAERPEISLSPVSGGATWAEQVEATPQ